MKSGSMYFHVSGIGGVSLMKPFSEGEPGSLGFWMIDG